jgi:hypothetical protein
MRVIVCGGLSFQDRDLLYATLDVVRAEHGELVVVHGAARGTDSLAGEWARERGQQEEPHPAAWGKYGRAAGPIRNAEMVKQGAGLCLAFPGGRGTADCVSKCEKAGIPVRHVGGTEQLRIPS